MFIVYYGGALVFAEPTVRARPERLSALRMFHSNSIFCGAFVWARPNRGYLPGQFAHFQNTRPFMEETIAECMKKVKHSEFLPDDFRFDNVQAK